MGTTCREGGEVMSPEDAAIVNAMAAYGGSFVNALAKACQLADAANFERIKKAFPWYWEPGSIYHTRSTYHKP